MAASCVGALALVLVSFLGAPPVRAQTDDDDDVESGADEPSGATNAPASPAPSQPEEPVGRPFAGVFAGLGLVLVSTILGTIIGSIIAGANPCDPHDLCLNVLAVVIGASIGSGVGLALVYPLGVALGSDAAGGRGGVGWSYLGGLIGLLAGGAIYAAGAGIQLAVGDPWGYIMVPAIVLGAGAALVGPVLAYEISHHDAARGARSEPRERSELTWAPTLRIDAHGAAAGLIGSF